MGKKKSRKITEEDRIKLLQMKLDAEEEEKKRKEQLISIFLKNKIAKEEAFARLNLSKINQNWHYILRKAKCKSMKNDVELMKQAMNRLLSYKNSIIEKLLEELEMAEEQYMHNLNSHFIHMDGFVDIHADSSEKYLESYESNMMDIIDVATKEQEVMFRKFKHDMTDMRTIIFTQEQRTEKEMKVIKGKFEKKTDEITCTFRLELEALRKRLEARISAIWREIAAIIRSYIGENDTRRLHYAELKKLDAESAVEIANNQERIIKQEKEIENLQNEFDIITRNSQIEIEELTEQFNELTKKFEKSRQQLRKELDLDKRKIAKLAEQSNLALEYLTSMQTKVKYVLTMAKTCQKYETEEESLMRWLPEIDEEEQQSQELKSYDDLGVEHLMKLGRFWERYSRVQLNLKELKSEKRRLLEENKKIRGSIRAVLEADALEQSRVSTRVSSKARSAPLVRSR